MSSTILAVALLAWCAGAHAYPSFWAASAPSCTALPSTALACHKAAVVDKTIVISVLEPGGKPAAKICSGKPYTINVAYSSSRLAYVTTSPPGAVTTKTTANVRCPNSLSFDKTNAAAARPATSSSLVAVAPKGPTWTIAVASATGGCAPYLTSTATVKLAAC